MSFVLVATFIFIFICLMFNKHIDGLKGKKDDKKKDDKKKDDKKKNKAASLPVPAEQIPNYSLLRDTVIVYGTQLQIVDAPLDECGTVCDSNPECTSFVRSINTNDCTLYSKGTKNKHGTPNAFNTYEKKSPRVLKKECPAYEKKEDTYYPAGTIGEPRPNSTPENCQMLCQGTSECNGFMYTKDNSKMCTLKSSFENEQSYRGIDTYFKRPCNP